jgi:hypothetical protein
MLSISCILKPNSKYLRTFSEAGKNGKANSDRGARYRNPDTEEAIWNKGMYFDSYIRLELKMPDSHNYSADIGRQVTRSRSNSLISEPRFIICICKS